MADAVSQNLYFTGQSSLELRSEPLVPLEPAELRVKSLKSLISTGTESICYTRSFEAGTHWDNWVKYPFAPGYSLIGEVVEAGADVTVPLGSRVALRRPHHQFVTVTEDKVFPVPTEVDSEDATFFALAKIVQTGVRRAEHVLGERVVIVGLGLLGQLLTQYLRLLGAREVIAIDLSEARLELAKASGATATIKQPIDKAYDVVMRLTNGQGADTVYDVTGAAPVFALALPLVKRFGKMIILGDTGKPSEQRLTSDVIRRGLTIIGAHDTHPPEQSSDYAYWNHEQIVRLFFSYLARGDMNVAPLISHRFSPAEAERVYSFLQTDRLSAMGVIFDWETV